MKNTSINLPSLPWLRVLALQQLAFLFIIFSWTSLQAQSKIKTSGNPLFPGWYADPEVAVFGNTFWIFPTYSQVFDMQVFLDAFSSRDLVQWQKHPRILDTSTVTWVRRALWAPAVIEKKGKYYLFFGANDIQSNDEPGGIGVAVADKPAGPYQDLLGKPLIDRIHNGAQPIDQFVFKDKDGGYYMFYGGWGHCNVARLNDAFSGFMPFEDGTVFKEVTPENYKEGPFMFMRKGKYYFMWSEGDWGGPDYSVAYAIADSPLGPFKRVDKILEQNPAIATGAGHHSVLQIPGKDKWYIVYHRRPAGQTDPNYRVTCMDEMQFDQDGFIKPIVISTSGVPAETIRSKNSK